MEHLNNTPTADRAKLVEEFSTPAFPKGDFTLALIEIVRMREALSKIACADYGTDTPKLRYTAKAALAKAKK